MTNFETNSTLPVRKRRNKISRRKENLCSYENEIETFFGIYERLTFALRDKLVVYSTKHSLTVESNQLHPPPVQSTCLPACLFEGYTHEITTIEMSYFQNEYLLVNSFSSICFCLLGLTIRLQTLHRQSRIHLHSHWGKGGYLIDTRKIRYLNMSTWIDISFIIASSSSCLWPTDLL